MSHRISFFLSRKVLIFAVCTFVGCATVVVIFATTPINARNATTVQSLPSYKQRVRVWIHGDGIRPQIVHAKPGVVLLTVENKTILDAELVLERASDQLRPAIRVITIPHDRERRNQEFLLTEGDYVLYERSRPTFRAKLVISPT